MINEATSTKDYRNTSFKYCDFTLGDKKESFMKDFRTVHTRAWNIYSNIKSRQSILNRNFKAIYHDKCVYCGINTHVIELSRFEIDHFIPQAVLEKDLGYSKEEINGIYNLVNSCNLCNRKKSSFITDRDTFQKLHPDKEELAKIFERLDDFSIVINNDHTTNNEVVKFYKTLNLDNQIRRLDFLIMEMKDFCEKYPKESIVPQINALILKIESKRRKNY